MLTQFASPRVWAALEHLESSAKKIPAAVTFGGLAQLVEAVGDAIHPTGKCRRVKLK